MKCCARRDVAPQVLNRAPRWGPQEKDRGGKTTAESARGGGARLGRVRSQVSRVRDTPAVVLSLEVAVLPLLHGRRAGQGQG
eukprot:gene24280-biopygen1347